MKSQNRNNRISLSSMGYLTMIIALAPSVAGFSGVEQPLRKAPAVAAGTGPRRVVRRASRTAVRTIENRSPSQLNYITDRTSSDLVDPNGSNSRSKHSQQWWNSIFGGGEQTSAADEYLEFLDKRYNSILKDDSAQEPREASRTGFPVLNWLYQTGGSDVSSQKHREEDALYVLGVAGLASKKLLQKHNLLPEKEAPVVDTMATPVMSESGAASARVSNLFRHVAHKREVFLRSQTRYAHMAISYTARSLVTGPAKALRKFYALGGGHMTLAVTLTVLTALSIVLRPVVRDATVGVISP